VLEPLRRWQCRYPRTLVVQDFDGNLFEVRLNEHMGSHIFWFGSYSREILLALGRLLRPGMVVIDVGANMGEVALFATKRVAPGGRVICFEPVPALAASLEQSIRRNEASGIEVVNCGLADRIGSAVLFNTSERFHDGTDHAGLATIYPQEGRSTVAGRVSLTTLDEFLRPRAPGRVDVIKIDAEGAELPILRGAVETLRTWHPHLILEVQRATSKAAGYDQREILQFLEGMEYGFWRIGRRGKLSALSVEALGDFQNVLCVPGGSTSL